MSEALVEFEKRLSEMVDVLGHAGHADAAKLVSQASAAFGWAAQALSAQDELVKALEAAQIALSNTVPVFPDIERQIANALSKVQGCGR